MNIQWDLNLDCFCHNILELSKHGQIVLALDVFWVRDHHSSNETTKWGDTVPLADTELIVSLNQRSAHC